eukprot:gene37441-46189_t
MVAELVNAESQTSNEKGVTSDQCYSKIYNLNARGELDRLVDLSFDSVVMDTSMVKSDPVTRSQARLAKEACDGQVHDSQKHSDDFQSPDLKSDSLHESLSNVHCPVNNKDTSPQSITAVFDSPCREGTNHDLVLSIPQLGPSDNAHTPTKAGKCTTDVAATEAKVKLWWSAHHPSRAATPYKMSQKRAATPKSKLQFAELKFRIIERVEKRCPELDRTHAYRKETEDEIAVLCAQLNLSHPQLHETGNLSSLDFDDLEQGARDALATLQIEVKRGGVTSECMVAYETLALHLLYILSADLYDLKTDSPDFVKISRANLDVVDELSSQWQVAVSECSSDVLSGHQKQFAEFLQDRMRMELCEGDADEEEEEKDEDEDEVNQTTGINVAVETVEAPVGAVTCCANLFGGDNDAPCATDHVSSVCAAVKEGEEEEEEESFDFEEMIRSAKLRADSKYSLQLPCVSDELSSDYFARLTVRDAADTVREWDERQAGKRREAELLERNKMGEEDARTALKLVNDDKQLEVEVEVESELERNTRLNATLLPEDIILEYQKVEEGEAESATNCFLLPAPQPPLDHISEE